MRKPPSSPSRRAFLKVLAGGAASVTATASSHPRGAQTTRIGVLLPSSTMYPRLGENFLAGLRLALSSASADEAHGALLLTASAGHTPSQAVRAVDELLSRHRADVLVGMIGSNAAVDVKPLLARHRRSFLVATHGANTERPEQRDPRIATISLGGWQSAWETGFWSVGRYGPRAVVVTSLYDTGYDHAYMLAAGIEAASGEVLRTIVTDDASGGHDFFAAIEQVRRLRPDVVVLLHSHPNAVETLARLDPGLFADLPFVTTGPVHGGMDARVSTLTSWAPAVSTTENESFVARYTALQRVEPDAAGLLGFESGRLLDLALSQQGSFQPERPLQVADFEGFASPRGSLAIQPGTTLLSAPRHRYEPSIGWSRVDLAGQQHRASAEAALATLHAAPRTGWLHDYLCV